MWLFLGSECLLFGGLISTYMLYRGRVSDGPHPEQIFDIPFTSVSSFVLLMSSLSMVLAVTSAQRKDYSRTNLWLLVTAILGATFVGGQIYEFTAFYREGLGFSTSLFSSSFYTLTGFHGVHVTVGVIMLLSTVGILKKNRATGDKAESVECGLHQDCTHSCCDHRVRSINVLRRFRTTLPSITDHHDGGEVLHGRVVLHAPQV